MGTTLRNWGFPSTTRLDGYARLARRAGPRHRVRTPPPRAPGPRRRRRPPLGAQGPGPHRRAPPPGRGRAGGLHRPPPPRHRRDGGLGRQPVRHVPLDLQRRRRRRRRRPVPDRADRALAGPGRWRSGRHRQPTASSVARHPLRGPRHRPCRHAAPHLRRRRHRPTRRRAPWSSATTPTSPATPRAPTGTGPRTSGSTRPTSASAWRPTSSSGATSPDSGGTPASPSAGRAVRDDGEAGRCRLGHPAQMPFDWASMNPQVDASSCPNGTAGAGRSPHC